MGNTQVEGQLGKSSTANEVVIHFGGKDSLPGKTAIVTGGHGGIGLETTKQLVGAGAKVIVGSRSVASGRKCIEAAGIDTTKVEVLQLDLESLASIKDFADKVQQEPRIDYIVLNAGIMALPTAEYTQHGFEKQIGTNHFGHFYLTNLLLDKVKAQSFPSRIVALSSKLHTGGNVEPADLHFKNGRAYSPWTAYGQSKAANVLFIRELADRLKDTSVTAVSLHPGVIHTGLFKNAMPTWLASIVGPFIFDKTVEQGAATTITALLDPALDSHTIRGSYLSDCQVTPTNEHCADKSGELRKALWKATEEQIEAALANSK